jgi:folylpolyglutamate synthase/dihydropteroate synthase
LRRWASHSAHLPPVIHIAGTNGKGSTQAMIRAGLEGAGARVHAYTSPHLARFHERIRLAGELIDEAALTALLDECPGRQWARADHLFRNHHLRGLPRLFARALLITRCWKWAWAGGWMPPMSCDPRR